MTLGHVLITGGSGFIGRHLIAAALPLAAKITVLDLMAESSPEVEHLSVDIRDADSVKASMPMHVDTIYHLAARTSVLESMNDPQGVFETNVSGTQNILESARMRGTERILLASTNAVVGDYHGDRISETTILRPLTPYGSTKAAAEMLASAYSASYGISSKCLRLTNVYGEGMLVKDSVVARMMKTALSGGTFSIYGDGEQFRDYVHVEDVANAFIQLSTKEYQGPVVIGSGTSVTVNQLVKSVSNAAGVEIIRTRVAAKPGEMRGVAVTNDLARSLAVQFRISLEEGLRRTWEDFKVNFIAPPR